MTRGQSDSNIVPMHLTLMDLVETNFREGELDYEVDHDACLLRVCATLSGVFFILAVRIDEERRRTYLYMTLDRRVPEECRQEVGQYIERANWGLLEGRFEMDWPSGEIRFTCMVDFLHHAQPRASAFRGAVGYGGAVFEQYMPGVIAIIEGGTTAVAAIEAVEA